MTSVQCPVCHQSEQVIQLAVDLGETKGYRSVHFCAECHAVFGFQPLRSLGPVLKVEEVDGDYRFA